MDKTVTEMCHEIKFVKKSRVLGEVAAEIGITLTALKKQMTRNQPTQQFMEYYQSQVEPFLDDIILA